jgi:hypothetical protein
VRGGGVELGADEVGEAGREEDRDGIEPQARVGAVLLDVGGGEPGQARDELAVEEQERPGGPDVERDARVAQAPAEQFPPAVFADEPAQLGRGRGRDGDVAGQAAGGGPGEEVSQQVAVTGGAVEPGIDVGLGGGAQGGAAVIEPGQECQGGQDAAAGPPGGGHGGGAAGAAPGAAQHVPGRVGAHESGVVRGAAGEDLAEPGLDPLKVLVPRGKDAGLDEHVAHVMEGRGLGLLVEQGVGELPVMGCRGQRGQERAAGHCGEPAGDRPRAARAAEVGQDGLELGRDAQDGVGQRGVQLLAHRAPGAGPPPRGRLGAAAGWAGELGRVAGARTADPAAVRAGSQEHLVLAAARAVRRAGADLPAAGAADGSHRPPRHDGPALAA